MVDRDPKVKVGDDGELIGLPSDGTDSARIGPIPNGKHHNKLETQNRLETILCTGFAFEFVTTRSLDSCIRQLRREERPEPPTRWNRQGKTEVSIAHDSVNMARFMVSYMVERGIVAKYSGKLERLENNDTIVTGEITFGSQEYIIGLIIIAFGAGIVIFSALTQAWPIMAVGLLVYAYILPAIYRNKKAYPAYILRLLKI